MIQKAMNSAEKNNVYDIVGTGTLNNDSYIE